MPNPVAIVRVPRERMVGHGIASSLFHEVGHQVAALLDVLPSLRNELQRRGRGHAAEDRLAWHAYERWVSEIVADFWSVSRAGLASTLGLMSVVSLPRWFVFRVNLDDPHPMPWLRVLISAAIGNALYPHQQWHAIATLWRSMYPSAGLDAERQALVKAVLQTLPRFVEMLMHHRPAKLRGATLLNVGRLPDRTPAQLDRLQADWRGRLEPMRNASPSLVFAVMGQARSRGTLSPEKEAVLLRRMLTYWALRSSLDTTAVVVAGQRLPIRTRGAPAPRRPASTLKRKELAYA